LLAKKKKELEVSIERIKELKEQLEHRDQELKDSEVMLNILASENSALKSGEGGREGGKEGGARAS